MLLCGYAAPSRERRAGDIERKRREYLGYCEQYYWPYDDEAAATRSGRVTPELLRMRQQIRKDVPRTAPPYALFRTTAIQAALERVLYVWSVRHPASGYVQGMNDLMTPFFAVFLSPKGVEAYRDASPAAIAELEAVLAALPAGSIAAVEADAFFCAQALLDAVQHHYTLDQVALQQQVLKLAEVVRRIHAPLYAHITQHCGIDFLSFSFRWFNCLLLRELPLPLACGLWDTYLSEGPDFPRLHLYVCAALLVRFATRVVALREATDVMLVLQQLPTAGFSPRDVEMLVAEAHQLVLLYGHAPAHLSGPVAGTG